MTTFRPVDSSSSTLHSNTPVDAVTDRDPTCVDIVDNSRRPDDAHSSDDDDDDDDSGSVKSAKRTKKTSAGTCSENEARATSAGAICSSYRGATLTPSSVTAALQSPAAQ